MAPDPAIPRWIVTADTQRARLFAAASPRSGPLRLELLRELTHHHEEQHPRGRPTLSGGDRANSRNAGQHGAPHSVGADHAREEDTARFARAASEWLETSFRELGHQPTVIFAPPRFLGLLRHEIHSNHPPPELHEAELTNLDAAELAALPKVRAVLHRP